MKNKKIQWRVWIPILLTFTFSMTSLYVSLANNENTLEQINLSQKSYDLTRNATIEQIEMSQKNYEISKNSNDLDVCSKKKEDFFKLIEECNINISDKSILKEYVKNTYITCMELGYNQANYSNISYLLLNISCYAQKIQAPPPKTSAQAEAPEQQPAASNAAGYIVAIAVILIIAAAGLYFADKKDKNNKA